MEAIYALAGIILMLFTCFIAWVNWRILRVSEDLLDISQILLDETILVRKGLDKNRQSTKRKDKPIPGTKVKK